MTPATIIREAQADGVRLALSPAGNIKVIGEGAMVARWLAVIRESKAEIVEALKGGTTRPRCKTCQHRKQPGRSDPGYCSGRNDLPYAYGEGHPLRRLPNDAGATCKWHSGVVET